MSIIVLFKRLFKFIFLASGLLILLIVINYHWVSAKGNAKIYNQLNQLPFQKVGLVLGTSKYVSTGKLNTYYTQRINIAVSLFKAHKISYILVSGDNHYRSYNEPSQMRKDLIAQGVPQDKIVLDYAGFRTLDSIVRAYKVFGLKSFTVISQRFHIQRALLIAEYHGINAIGYSLDTGTSYLSSKVQFREYLARVKMLLDFLLSVQPKFLGDPIKIH